MKRTGGVIKITSAIITVISLIAIITITTKIYTFGNSENLILNLANAFFQIFLGVIIVNLLIETALDRERKELERSEERRKDEQKKIEKEQWDNTIQPFLLQEIFNTALTAFHILDTSYKISEDKLIIQLEQIDVHALRRNILRFRREKQNYLMYLGWFIDKMSLEQTLRYQRFEGKFDALDYWLQELSDNDNQDKIDLFKKAGKNLTVGQIILRVKISISVIFKFVDQFIPEEQRILKKVATETLGTKKQLENIYVNYQDNLHSIEVTEFDEDDKKDSRNWKLTWSINNFFIAHKIIEEYTKELNATASGKN